MKSIRSSILVRLAMASLLAIGLGAGLARAQEVAGKFTLPFEVRWGAANLPAGNYSFTVYHSMASGTASSILEVCRGTRGVALIMNQSYNAKSSGRSELTVVRDSAGNTVRDMSLPQLGEILYYASSKSKRSNAAEERETAQNIPVTPVAK